jgi:hypothetical protein
VLRELVFQNDVNIGNHEEAGFSQLAPNSCEFSYEQHGTQQARRALVGSVVYILMYSIAGKTLTQGAAEN